MITTEFNVFGTNTGEWRLYPIGDLQFGTPGFSNHLWDECEDRIKSDKNALTIGMGDYSDLFRPTNQKKIDSATAGDGDFRESFDELYREHNRKIFKKIAPVFKKGRCLGLLSGHHEHRYANGITSSEELCQWLGVPYLEELGFIRLKFFDNSKIRKPWKMKILAQHGEGGAGLIGPDVANLERKTAPSWNADLFLRGHSTKKWFAESVVFDMSDQSPPKLIEKTKLLVNTGGFMAGYIEGQSTYVSKRNMPPAALGYMIVTLNLERHNGYAGRPHTGLADKNIRLGIIKP